MSAAAPRTLHASCVARAGRGILLAGGPGAGKSDLGLRLIDRGALLVSDDYTVVRRERGRLVASPPETIAGKMEVRGIGIVDLENAQSALVCLHVDLESPVERLPPEAVRVSIAGVEIPAIALDAREASAPIKVELALERYGLTP
ncbi:MAG: HPr kinase/phosphorylase [Sphingomonadaceae bacterium]